ncbi:MAG: helix-turn-helix domain-containing protein [Bradymonadia bacterium]
MSHDDIADHLAENVRTLREARGLTQAQIARLAGVPRPTWSNVESGAANPTLSVLLKVAEALHVRLDELLGPPKRTGQLYRADALPTRQRGLVCIRKLLPESMPGLDIERMLFEVGGSMAGIPHTFGTREYLTCESGHIELSVGGERFELSEGDVVVFRGDQKHGYRNLASGQSVAYSVVTFAPSGS